MVAVVLLLIYMYSTQYSTDSLNDSYGTYVPPGPTGSHSYPLGIATPVKSHTNYLYVEFYIQTRRRNSNSADGGRTVARDGRRDVANATDKLAQLLAPARHPVPRHAPRSTGTA